MKQKFVFAFFTSIITFGFLILGVACCSSVEKLEQPDVIEIRDSATGKPLRGIGVTELRQLTKFEKWLATDVFKHPDYKTKITDKNGIVRFRLKGSSYWIMTSHFGPKIIIINGKLLHANPEGVKVSSRIIGKDILTAKKDGTLNIDHDKFKLLGKSDQAYVRAIKEIGDCWYSLRNDGKGNFAFYSGFECVEPEYFFATSPIFLTWRVNSSPEAKEILVGIDLEKSIRLTGVEFEPEGIFYVEKITPLSSEGEAKRFGSLLMRNKLGIKNKYIVTIRPKTTERKAEIELVKFRTDPPLPDKIGDPYLGYLSIDIK